MNPDTRLKSEYGSINLPHDTLLFPRCGLTYGDVLSLEGMTMKDAAHKLGVNYKHLWEVAKEHNLRHLFPRPSRKLATEDMVMPVSGITRQDIESCRGSLQIDAAHMLGVSQNRLCLVLKKHPDLRSLFPACGGEAQTIAKKGYAMTTGRRRWGK